MVVSIDSAVYRWPPLIKRRSLILPWARKKSTSLSDVMCSTFRTFLGHEHFYRVYQPAADGREGTQCREQQLAQLIREIIGKWSILLLQKELDARTCISIIINLGRGSFILMSLTQLLASLLPHASYEKREKINFLLMVYRNR